MAKLITDFFCVGTAGATVDGRTLQDSWFKDSAKHYDPALYQARMWYEHYRWYGAWGDVYATRAKKAEDGTLKLYNRVAPSPELIELWRNGQKLYSSIEIIENFAKRGHAYQVGLGITDSPASLGTDRQEYAAFKEQECFGEFCKLQSEDRVNKYKERVQGFDTKDGLQIFVGEELPDMELKKERTFFDFGLGSLFGGNTDQPSKPTTTDKPNEDTTEMTKEEMAAAIAQAFKEQIKPVTDRLDDLEQKFNAQDQDDGSTDNNTDSDADNAGDDSGNHYQELSDKMDGLATQFSDVMKKFKQTDADDEHRDEVDGSDNMPDFL